MSLQKFIDSLPASITKYQGFAVGRHTRALRDPELRKHPLLILGYQTQRKALKFQPVNREPWSSWEHGYHININALSKILTPKSRPENITASNLLFNSAAHIRFVRGHRPLQAKDKNRERTLEFRASQAEKMKENWPYVANLISMVRPTFVYLYSHQGYLTLREAQPDIFIQRLTTLPLGYDNLGRTFADIYLDLIQVPNMDHPCILVTGPDFMVMTYKSDPRLNEEIVPIKPASIQKLSSLAANLAPQIRDIDAMISAVDEFQSMQSSHRHDRTVAVEGFSAYAYTRI